TSIFTMKPLRLRQRLYRLQQRAALTTAEAGVLLGIAAVLLVGLGTRYVQGEAVPVTAAHYAPLDQALVEGSAAPEAPAARAAAPDAAKAPPVAAPVPAAPAPAAPAPADAAGPVRLNLNTAPPRLLERLPRIGPKLAERIVEYRARYGPFEQAADVQNVKGIGPKTFERFAAYVYVGAE
ncbi:MAG: helix-hairpin-helix domain-containing protein, partial [Rhodothermales bacterium]|nr:helix-hairpin-helix domain-containing protein [Rhodothermales bacterium]